MAFEPDAKSGTPVLGLVTDKVGKKKNMFTVSPAAAAASGSSATVAVALRQVVYVVPGGDAYTTKDLLSFEDDFSLDSSLLEDAWHILVDEATQAKSVAEDEGENETMAAGTSDPRGMAELLMGDANPDPKLCYNAFRLLHGEQGTLRFKRRRDGRYEARSR